MAAPVGGQILGEVLPYLEVNQTNTEDEKLAQKITMPDFVGKSIKEVKEIIKEEELDLEVVIQNETEEMDLEKTIVKNQMPEAGIQINKGNKIYIEYET